MNKFIKHIFLFVFVSLFLIQVSQKIAFATCTGGFYCRVTHNVCTYDGTQDLCQGPNIPGCSCNDVTTDTPITCSGSSYAACTADDCIARGLSSSNGGLNSGGCGWTDPAPPPTATPVPQPYCSSTGAVAGSVCSDGANFPACPGYTVEQYYTATVNGCGVSQWYCTSNYCGPAPTNTPVPGVPTDTPAPGVPTNTPVPPTPTAAQNVTCSSSCTGTACNGGANNLVQNLCTDNNTGQVVSNISTCDTAQCANSTTPVCDSGFGVCGCSGNCRDGANTDFSCCHRSCANNTCTTVSGSGTQECNGEGSACGVGPPPATCPGNVCTCSGASAASCGECGGGWCNGGVCSTCSSGGGTGNPGPTQCSIGGPVCQYWTADTTNPATGQNVHASGIKKGAGSFTSTNKMTVDVGQIILFQADTFNLLPGDCQWSIDMKMNIIRTDQGFNDLKLTCYENKDPNDNHAYFCNNGAPYVAFNDDPYKNAGYAGYPDTTVLPYQEQCADIGPSGIGNGRRYKCGPCSISGEVAYCFRGGTRVTQGNDIYDHSPMPMSYSCTDPQTGNGDSEYIPTDACKVSGLDNYQPALHTYAEYADDKAKKKFQNPGVYTVEYSGLRSGQGGGNSMDTPCQIQVTVKNPNPPTGTIQTNDAQNRCIIPEKNPDGTPATTCDIGITWTTADVDTAKITYREGGTDFLPETTTQLSGTATANVSADTKTFDLYGKSASFDTYYTSHGALASIAFHGNPYINGNVYVDTNEDGVQNNGETAYAGGGVVFINGAPTNLDPSGHFLRLDLAPTANPIYTVAFAAPSGYESTTPASKSTSLSVPTTVNFGIAPLHTVTGKIFNDQNKNKVYDAGDSAYTTTQMNLQATRIDGTIVASTTTDGNGNYTLTNLPSGLLNISMLSAVPTGFRVIWPVGTTPPTYTPQVGPACGSGPLDNTTGASYINTQQCNIQNLNFAISNSIPWLQMMGSDGRFDTGTNNGQFTNFVANSLACNSGYTLLPGANSVPGVALIGSSSRDTAFGGVGVGSSNNWVLGSPFPEYFTTFGSNPNATGQGLQTSYDYVLNAATTSNITPKNFTSITGCTDLNSCSISPVTTNGIFKADSSVVLNGATFGSGKNYILLINGDLTIKGNITVPTGSTATFAVKGDIIIDKTVGVSSFTCPTTATSGQIQGFFSADKSIIIGSKDPSGSGSNCSDAGPNGGADLQLNVDGSLVANAGLSSGGFENRRDLCALNITYPVLTLKERLDFMLNAPELLKTQNYIYREIAP